MKNDKKFLNPKAEIINFLDEDVILTSTGVGEENANIIPEYDPDE